MLLAAAMEVPVTRIGDDARFVGDIGVSSINAIAALLALEETFQIGISDEDAEGLTTFSHVVAFLKQHELIVK